MLDIIREGPGTAVRPAPHGREGLRRPLSLTSGQPSGDGTFRPRLDIEKAENLFLVQAQRRRRFVVRNQIVEELPFALQHLGDPAFNRTRTDKPNDEYRLALANAMRPVDRLILDGRVPPTVK